MSTEHLNNETIEKYRRRQVEPAQLRETEAHLSVCNRCLQRVLSDGNSTLAFDSLNEAFLAARDEPFHLSPTLVEDFQTGRATEADRIIYESHLESCHECGVLVNSPPAAKTASPLSQSHLFQRQWANAFTPARAIVVIALVGVALLAALLWLQRNAQDELVSRPAAPASPQASAPVESAPSPEGTNSTDGSIVARLKDGEREILLHSNGKLTGLEDLDQRTQSSVRDALSREGLAKPRVLDDIKSPPIQLLGERPGEDSFQLISPLGKVVLEDRPGLRWQPLREAAAYTVSVYDDKFNLVEKSPSLSKAEWRVTRSLSRGKNYSWEVVALRDGLDISAPANPDQRAQFRILGRDEANAVARLKQKRASRLALGLAYAQAGLIDEAQEEFRRLAKENPDSAVARKLLTSVQSWKQ